MGARGGMAHKGLKLPKRFTNLLLGSMSLILNLMGLMHPYESLDVPQTPKSCDALIEVFKYRKIYFEVYELFCRS